MKKKCEFLLSQNARTKEIDEEVGNAEGSQKICNTRKWEKSKKCKISRKNSNCMHVFFLVLLFCWAKLGRVFTRIEAQISHAPLSPLEHCCIFLRNMCYWENQPCHCASLHPRLVFCASLFHFAFRFFKKKCARHFWWINTIHYPRYRLCCRMKTTRTHICRCGVLYYVA